MDKLGELDRLLTLVLIGVGAFVAYNLYRHIENGNNPFVPDPNDTTGDPNSPGDTSQAAYSGFGVLGSIGNIVNQALGGLPQTLGNNIAGSVSP